MVLDLSALYLVQQNPSLSIQMKDKFSSMLLVEVESKQLCLIEDSEICLDSRVQQNLEQLMKYLLLFSMLMVKRRLFLLEDTKALDSSPLYLVLQNRSLLTQQKENFYSPSVVWYRSPSPLEITKQKELSLFLVNSRRLKISHLQSNQKYKQEFLVLAQNLMYRTSMVVVVLRLCLELQKVELLTQEYQVLCLMLLDSLHKHSPSAITKERPQQESLEMIL